MSGPEAKWVPWTRESNILGVKIRHRTNGRKIMISEVTEFGIVVSLGTVHFETLFKFWEHMDGSPCGTEVKS